MAMQIPNRNLLILYRSVARKISPLKRMSLLYRSFLTSAEGAVFIDPNGDIIDANKSFLALYGYALDEVTGQNLRTIMSDQVPSSTFDDMWQCLTDKDVGTWSGEMTNHRRNGDEVTVLLTTNAIFDSTGTVVGYIGQHHDITRRKKHAEALQKKDIELEMKNRELEKLNQLKSDMMAITCHDLKSPIAAMIGYADLVKSHMDQLPKEKIMRYLNGIVDAGHSQLKFIDDLLDLYKFESDVFIIDTKPIRLDTLLSESVELNTVAGKMKQVAIRLTIEAAGGIVQADGVRMQQVFNNLLSNAIKYSPEESQIDVHYREIDGEKIQITIDDQGSGVFEADLDRIFDRYYQAKSKGGTSERLHGVGMGLYISKHIVNFHSGMLQVENLPKCGCRFTIEIPLTMSHTN